MREIEKKSSAVRHFAKLPAAVLVASAIGSVAVHAEEVKPAPKTEKVLAPIKVEADRQTDPNGTGSTYKAEFTTVGRTPAAVRDIPQATTSVTQMLMRDRDANTLKEALYNAPGITFNASEGGNSGDGIVMRGFAATNDIFLDNFRDAAQYNRDTFFIDRVEILRGPASMLYGKGSTGGVINQVSKTPFQSDLYSVSGTIGSHNFLRFEGDFNKGLSETSGLRVNMMKQKADSFREGAEQNRWGVAPSVKFGIGTPTEITVGFLHYEEDNIPDYGVPYFRGEPLPIADKFFGLTAIDRERNKVNAGTLDIQHRFAPGVTLHNATRLGKYETDMRASAPRLNTTVTGGELTDASKITRGRPLRLREQDIASNLTDLTFKLDTGALRHELVTGLELTREKLDLTSRAHGVNAQGGNLTCTLPEGTVGNPGANTPVACAPLVTTAIGKVSAQTTGLFIQDLIALNPQFKVLLGARYDRFKTEVDTRPQVGPNAGKVIDARQRKESVWSTRAGLIWQPDSTQSYYAAYGTSFNPSAEAYALDRLGMNTPPEKNKNYEIGAKWDLLNKQLSLRTAIFNTIKTNERQTDVTNTTPSEDYLLSGQRSTKGIELEAAGQINEHWSVFAGYAYMNPRIDKSDVAANVGKRPPNAPSHTANVWTSYRFNDSWKVGFGANSMGKRFADRYSNGSLLANNMSLPAFTRWDGMVEYTHRDLSAQLNVYNLSNKRYYEGFYPGFVTPGTDRSARLTVSYKFW
ncbi:TonB-dependent siderophore receptor [Chitinimonas arctica]|uniref:TonB-dependent siderophore receptor n=1 Tax=Chitinimonas arctica TaxID=2594795 RepID=A0A516SI02_9NEIS|nr:TonB-dependent siderophore receptor [Chitinimonas arctica]QDQ27784.1 TonB-dependent siderophore receptor [Chitinimonas arctica]